MFRYERSQLEGHSEDVVWLPPSTASEADEALAVAGFAAASSGELEDNIDAESGDWQPIGGRLALTRGGQRASMRLWSRDVDTGSRMGFACLSDQRKGIFYAKPAVGADTEGDDGLPRGSGSDRATKAAITALLDIAESCNARRITLGLGAEHAIHAEFICALLYLGFQVVPTRRCHFVNVALLLELDIAWPSQNPWPSSTDHTCTGTSNCSTSADEVEEAEITDNPDTDS